MANCKDSTGTQDMSIMDSNRTVHKHKEIYQCSPFYINYWNLVSYIPDTKLTF
jgi:hypothetical protein